MIHARDHTLHGLVRDACGSASIVRFGECSASAIASECFSEFDKMPREELFHVSREGEIGRDLFP